MTTPALHQALRAAAQKKRSAPIKSTDTSPYLFSYNSSDVKQTLEQINDKYIKIFKLAKYLFLYADCKYC